MERLRNTEITDNRHHIYIYIYIYNFRSNLSQYDYYASADYRFNANCKNILGFEQTTQSRSGIVSCLIAGKRKKMEARCFAQILIIVARNAREEDGWMFATYRQIYCKLHFCPMCHCPFPTGEKKLHNVIRKCIVDQRWLFRVKLSSDDGYAQDRKHRAVAQWKISALLARTARSSIAREFGSLRRKDYACNVTRLRIISLHFSWDYSNITKTFQNRVIQKSTATLLTNIRRKVISLSSTYLTSWLK